MSRPDLSGPGRRPPSAVRAAGGRVRLAVLVTHPIQYMAPLWRRIAQDPDIELTVLFESDLSLRAHADPGFGRTIDWDVPLLDGYRSVFLPAWGRTDRLDLLRPFSRGIGSALREGGYDWLFVHGYARPVHWLAILAARCAGIRVLVRDEATLVSKRRGMARRGLKRLFFAVLDRMVDGFLAIGTANAAYYRAHGVAAERITSMPYAVDNAFFRRAPAEAAAACRQRLGIPSEAPMILYASKLQARKHADVLLAAFRRAAFPGAAPHLVIAGDGELMPALRAAAEGDARIHVLGFQGQQDLVVLYAACDLFVLASSFETWGLVVNEAMAAGTAVLVSETMGCTADLVRDGVNGRVVPPADEAATTAALEDLCRDRERLRTMGAASRVIVDAWDFEADLRGLRTALGLESRQPADDLADPAGEGGVAEGVLQGVGNVGPAETECPLDGRD